MVEKINEEYQLKNQEIIYLWDKQLCEVIIHLGPMIEAVQLVFSGR